MEHSCRQVLSSTQVVFGLLELWVQLGFVNHRGYPSMSLSTTRAGGWGIQRPHAPCLAGVEVGSVSHPYVPHVGPLQVPTELFPILPPAALMEEEYGATSAAAPVGPGLTAETSAAADDAAAAAAAVAGEGRKGSELQTASLLVRGCPSLPQPGTCTIFFF